MKLQLVGIVAAIVLAAVVNVLGARHFTRSDWTTSKRWSLSPATIETLRSLEQDVDVWAITGSGDPMEPSLRQLLASYRAQSPRLVVHYIDPDRDFVQLVDLRRRFGLEAGAGQDGRVTTDAVVVVASGDRHWFLTLQDLFEQSDDTHARPREERALTRAVRNVLGGDKAKLCFTVGHGELSLEPARDEREWLGAIKDLLDKNNYELDERDTTLPGANEPFAGCGVVVVAGPRAPFSPEESNRLRTWLLEGGSAFFVVGPIDADTDSGMQPAGLDDALAPFGIAFDDQLVHDLDPSAAIPDTHGEGFLLSVRPHPVDAALVPGGADAHPPRVAMFYARSLRHVSTPGAAGAADLLVTSADAYAKKNVRGASAWTQAPPRADDDPKGPFSIAMASQRGKSRVVVVGTRFALAEDNWRQPRALHGAAFFVESALSWLAARPAVVDVPDKPEVAAGMRISEAGRDEVRRYVLVFMPLAALLLGAAVWAWRRSSENKPYDKRREASR